jgi:hypothetical protein
MNLDNIEQSVWGSFFDTERDCIYVSIFRSVEKSVWDYTGDSCSVENCCCNLVFDSVQRAIWDSVRESVWDAVYGFVEDSIMRQYESN